MVSVPTNEIKIHLTHKQINQKRISFTISAPWSCVPGRNSDHCFPECSAARRRKWKRIAGKSFAWSRGSRWVTSDSARDPVIMSVDQSAYWAGDTLSW